MKSRAFTLIELLVVISIIGILSAIVIASLNSARAKGVEGAIKSNLRSMISAAELAYDASNPNSYVNACASVTGMMAAIGNVGATSTCWTLDNTRWAASAKMNSSSAKNWSVDSTGVVTWDTSDISASANWDAAVAACAASGGRLPTVDQLKSLSLVYGSATPPSFVGTNYWSGTARNSVDAYYVVMSTGSTSFNPKSVAYPVRCVR